MKVLLAVSGGIDSMYMLARSGELFPGSSLAVAHCNFCLRGEESDGDERFVRDWCGACGLPVFVKRFDTAAFAKSRSISIEMAARDLRYAWFGELAAAEGFDAVAVAHNANDNAETLFLNLLRGTGSRGLRGMADRRLAGGILILRPLLGTGRAEIEAWMEEHGVPHREDSTNSDSAYKRNKLRGEVFPLLAQINPSFLRTLEADMRHFAQVDDIAEDYFRSSSPGVLLPGDGRTISIPALLSLKHWEYVLFRILEPYGFDEATLLALAALLRSEGTVSGKTFEAPAWKAVTASDKIIIVERKAGEGPSISVKRFPRPEDLQLQRPEGVLILDAGKVGEPRFRKWEAGDWMRPLGMKGRKKVSDLFVDLKWSLPRKEDAMVLVHPDGQKGHVGALLCSRIDDSLKVTRETAEILEVTLL